MGRSRIAAWLSLLLLAAQACAPVAGPTVAAPTDQPPATPVSASFTPSPTSAVDTSIGARPAGARAAILIDDDGTGQRLRARPIDPSSLGDIPGYVPIAFGHHYVARVSPDGATLAAILWPTGSANSGGTLHLIDTTSWVDRRVEVKVDAGILDILGTYTSAIHFDEVGRSLYWSQPTALETPTSGVVPHALIRFDLATGRARELARFSGGYYVRDLRVIGPRVAAWLVPVSGVMIDGKPREVPQVVVVDAGTGGVSATLRLPDLRAGYVQDLTQTSLDPSRGVEPGLAWDTPRARLYIADAESDRIYTLDLHTGTVRVAEPRPRRSTLDVLWSLLAQPAEAKLTNATRQYAAVSPDGTRLYVTGERTDFVKAQDGKLHEVITPIQLRVIDTSDLAELARLDAATTPLWVSPDGSRVLYGTARVDDRPEGYAAKLDFKLHVMDAAARRDIGTLAWPGPAWHLAFDPASRTAYVAAQPSGDVTNGHATLFAVGTGTGVVQARRALDAHFVDLIVLRPGQP
jgi:hypothetical protein